MRIALADAVDGGVLGAPPRRRRGRCRPPTPRRRRAWPPRWRECRSRCRGRARARAAPARSARSSRTQAAARAGVMAGAERHARIEHDADAIGRDRVDPRRMHEEPLADRQGRKVRLPVLRPAVVGERCRPSARAARAPGKARAARRRRRRARPAAPAGEMRDDAHVARRSPRSAARARRGRAGSSPTARPAPARRYGHERSRGHADGRISTRTEARAERLFPPAVGGLVRFCPCPA